MTTEESLPVWDDTKEWTGEEQEAELVRPLVDTNLFRAGQKCWVKYGTGSLAICVVGRYRGKGRYITAWLHAPRDYDPSAIRTIKMSTAFLERLGIDC